MAPARMQHKSADQRPSNKRQKKVQVMRQGQVCVQTGSLEDANAPAASSHRNTVHTRRESGTTRACPTGHRARRGREGRLPAPPLPRPTRLVHCCSTRRAGGGVARRTELPRLQSHRARRNRAVWGALCSTDTRQGSVRTPRVNGSREGGEGGEGEARGAQPGQRSTRAAGVDVKSLTSKRKTTPFAGGKKLFCPAALPRRAEIL